MSDEAAWRKAIADQVRANCTPSSEAYSKGGDVLMVPGSLVISAGYRNERIVGCSIDRECAHGFVFGQYEEDYKLPAWPVHIGVDTIKCRYSTTAWVTVPEGTRVRPVSS